MELINATIKNPNGVIAAFDDEYPKAKSIRNSLLGMKDRIIVQVPDATNQGVGKVG